MIYFSSFKISDKKVRNVGKIKHNHEIGSKYVIVGDLMDKITAEAVAEAVGEKDKETEKLRTRIAELEAN